MHTSKVLPALVGHGKNHTSKMVNLLGVVLLLVFAILKQMLTSERKYFQVATDSIAIGAKHLDTSRSIKFSVVIL